MSLTSETYVQQITDLAGSFSKSCAAAALFYWGNGANRGLRIEATTIMKEFVNNIEFGTDPEGLLFYNENSDFNFDPDDNAISYEIYYNTETPMAVRVDFFPPGGGDPFAKFLSKETNSVDSRLLVNGSGKWGDLKIAASFTKIHKITSGSKVTLKLQPVGKQVSFNVNDNSQHKKIDAAGALYFSNLKDLTAGTTSIANYDADRIIFYPSSDKNKYAAVFFPNEALPIDNHNDPNPPIATWGDL